jgi:hypothetical protein
LQLNAEGQYVLDLTKVSTAQLAAMTSIGDQAQEGGNLLVEGNGQFNNDVNVNGVLWVSPIAGQGPTTDVSDCIDCQELPAIENDADTSTVYTQIGAVSVETNTVDGGGVKIENNGNVSLLRAEHGQLVVNYEQVTAFLVNNDTGEAIDGTYLQSGGYFDDEGEFVVVLDTTSAELPEDQTPLELELNDDGQMVLDLEKVSTAQLAAMTSIDDSSEVSGGDLLVEGNAQIDGELILGGDLILSGDTTNPMGATTKSYVDRKIKNVKDDVDDNSDRLDEVGAMAAAFSAVQPNWKSPGNTQIALGLGYYESEGALAAGIFHHINDTIMINAGVSTTFSEQETAGRIGITWGF